MIDLMAEMDIGQNPNTKFDLNQQIDYLLKHYKSTHERYEIPIQINELRYVYKELAMQDGGEATDLDDRSFTDYATVSDLIKLLVSLSRHFHLNNSKDSLNLN